MKTAGSLSDRSKTELAHLAKSRGVRGWAAMDKSALVKALSKSTATPAGSAAKTAKPSKKATTKVVPVSKGAKAKPAAPRITRPAKPAPAPPPKPVVKVTAVAKPAAAQAKPATPVAPRPTAAAPVASKPTANGTHKAPGTDSAKPATKPLVPKTPPSSAVKPLASRGSTPPRDAYRDAPAPRLSGPLTKDRILLAVSNSYWLNAYWELSTHSVQRAEAALKQDWHGARLIIRLFDVTSQDTTSTSETPVKDIQLQGPGQNWYIDVPQPPRMYRADIGYVSRRGEFYVLARSNVVTPPKAGAGETGDAVEPAWDDNDAKWKAERILAMSTGFESAGGSPELREFLEERTGRTLGPPKETAFGTGALPPGAVKKFFFEIDAKLIVFGRTDPTAHLTLNNDPIKLNPDGTFRMTFNLPDSRQIIPAVAASADGVEERTIVLAVERNTKHLDPMIHDQMNEV
jgi:hypothetical protein